MAKIQIKAGTTSKLLDVFIQDSSSTTGAGLTGLVFNTAGLTAYYYREGAVSATAITLATMTLGTWATGGFVVIDGTNMPGCYQIGIPDAAIAAGAKSVLVLLKGATNMAPLVLEVELTAVDNQDAAAFGLSRIDAAVSSRMATFTLPTNFSSFSIDASGRVDTGKLSGTAQTARDIGASVLLSAGTGTGQLDFTSGVVKANLAQILGTALTETAGQIAGAFKKLFDVAAPTLTCLDVNQTGDSFARIGAAGASLSAIPTIAAVTTVTNLTNAPTAGDFTATMKTSLNAATPASVTGAVGSVTGAVGSVTGNVGGNVVGSVGSVTVVSDKTGYALSNAGVDAILDRTAGVDTGWTLRQAMRIMLSSLAGKLSGAATTTVTIRDMADTKARITATVDANGNRTAVTTDAT